MLKSLLVPLLLLMFTMCTLTSFASDKPVKLTIDVTYIELHSGPGAGYPVINVIEKGELVELIVKRTNWLKVKDQRNNIGWLNQDNLVGLTHQGNAVVSSKLTVTDFQKRNLEAGVMYGDFEGSDFYNVHLGYNFSSVFSAEVALGKALGNISDNDLYEVMLISQPFPELTVIPYLGVGGGIITTKPHSVLADSEKREDTFIASAIGIKYHLARNFILRAEYKYAVVLTDRNDNEEVQTWKLGFSVFF